MVIELLGASHVGQGEAVHLAFVFASMRLVAVVFGSGGGEIFDEVVVV